MITINGKVHNWHEGMSIESIINSLNYTYPMLMVTINHKEVTKEEYASTIIQRGDDIKIIHPICGG